MVAVDKHRVAPKRFDYLTVSSHASTLAFSMAEHSRPTTSLQLRLNHFSVFAKSVNRAASPAGARAVMALPVVACFPAPAGFALWQVAQLQSLPCFSVKNACPATGLAGAPVVLT
jgi:hypothetical protein